MVTTIDDIERKKNDEWKKSCKKEVYSQIVLNRLKKKKMINRKQAKNIQEKINKLGTMNVPTR